MGWCVPFYNRWRKLKFRCITSMNNSISFHANRIIFILFIFDATKSGFNSIVLQFFFSILMMLIFFSFHLIVYFIFLRFMISTWVCRANQPFIRHSFYYFLMRLNSRELPGVAWHWNGGFFPCRFCWLWICWRLIRFAWASFWFRTATLMGLRG